jgi:hypothetical protein
MKKIGRWLGLKRARASAIPNVVGKHMQLHKQKKPPG